MIKHIAKPLIATALLSCTQFASAIPLSDLFSGGTLTAANGIAFSGFNDNGGSIDASLIDVVAGASGLTFSAGQGVGLVDKDGSTSFTTLWFDYQVTAAANHTILGQSMAAEIDHSGCNEGRAQADGSTCGTTPAESGYTLIWKEIFDGNGQNGQDIVFVEGNETSVFNFYGISPTGNSASVTSASLTVDDYIEINVGEYEAGNLYLWIQEYTQRENPSQVPVPATLALFALGLLGMGASRRKA